MKQTNLPDEPPNADESWHTVEDERWRLENATSDRWHVESISFVENPGHGGSLPIDTSLEHDCGATIQCRALDPWGYHAGPEVIRSHRIKLESPTEDRAHFVTLDADRGVQYVNAERVEKADAYIKRVKPAGGHAHCVRYSDDALRCVCAAALRVSRAVAEVEKDGAEIVDYEVGQSALTTF